MDFYTSSKKNLRSCATTVLLLLTFLFTFVLGSEELKYDKEYAKLEEYSYNTLSRSVDTQYENVKYLNPNDAIRPEHRCIELESQIREQFQHLTEHLGSDSNIPENLENDELIQAKAVHQKMLEIIRKCQKAVHQKMSASGQKHNAVGK
eukprot:107243_1